MRELEKLEKNSENDKKILEQEYISDMYKIAKTRLHSDDDIYDAIQETYYKLYKNKEKIKTPEKVKLWLVKVLINECNRIYRSRKKEERLQEKLYYEKLKDVNYGDEIDEFEIILRDLKHEDKIILTLYYGSNFTTKEIAKILKRNENTIKTRMKRAKDYIKINIEKEEEK